MVFRIGRKKRRKKEIRVSKRSMRHPGGRACGVLLIALSLFGCITPVGLLAQPASLLEALQTLHESLELAVYLSKASALALDITDVRVNLSELSSLLDDESVETSIPRLVANVKTQLALEQLAPTLELNLSSALDSAAGYIAWAQDVLGVPQDAGWEVLHDVSRRAYAYLSAALGGDELGFQLAGIAQMIAWLPNSVVRVSPEDDLQRAIDQVLSGGTVVLTGGTYVLDSEITIAKSVRLIGEPSIDAPVQLLGPRDESAISVGSLTSDRSIDVAIENVIISGGKHGVNVSADYRSSNLFLTLSNVEVADCEEAGVFIFHGNVVLDTCSIRRNGTYGVQITSAAVVEILDSVVSDNGTTALADLPYRSIAGIHATGSAELVVQASTIEHNAGSGIHVERDVALVLADTRLSSNGRDGLCVWDDVTLEIVRSQFLGNDQMGIRFGDGSCDPADTGSAAHVFGGTVAGEDNIIPDSGTPLGNGTGSICPTGLYTFLLQSSP